MDESKPPAPEGKAWELVVPNPEPFGYVCVFFGARESPRCEGEVRLLNRWQDASEPACKRTMTLYWAPMQSPKAPPEREVPGTKMSIRSFSSDGVQFSFIRIDDHILEATSCLAAESKNRDDLIAWGSAFTTR